LDGSVPRMNKAVTVEILKQSLIRAEEFAEQSRIQHEAAMVQVEWFKDQLKRIE
jgi:hypothetical protein